MKRLLLAAVAALMMAGTATAAETHTCNVHEVTERLPNGDVMYTPGKIADLTVSVTEERDGPYRIGTLTITRGERPVRVIDLVITTSVQHGAERGSTVMWLDTSETEDHEEYGVFYDTVTGKGRFYQYGRTEYVLTGCRGYVTG